MDSGSPVSSASWVPGEVKAMKKFERSIVERN